MTNRPEAKIQHKIINHLREQGLIVLGTANGQFLNTWNGIAERSTLGKGLPDLFVCVPAKRSITGQPVLIGLEIKTEKGRATKEQLAFIAFINSIKGDVHGFIAHGYDEAINFISPLLKERDLDAEYQEFLNTIK